MPRLVTVSVTASPGGTATMLPIAPLNGPIPLSATRPRMARPIDRPDDRQEDRPVGLGRCRLLQSEGVAAVAHRRPERDRRATADAALGQLGGGEGRRTRSPAHGATDGPRGRPTRARRGAATAGRSPIYQRSVAATSASTSAVVRTVTIAPSAPASRQRAHVSRGASTQGLPVSPLVARTNRCPGTRPGRAGRPVAGRSPRAPRGRPAGARSKSSSKAVQPSPIRPARRAPAAVSPPMTIGGGGSGTGR